jgi:hypothetical protein
MRMTRKFVAAFVVIALCGAAAFATIGLAGEGATRSHAASASGALESTDVAKTLHRVSVPGDAGAASATTAAQKGKKPRIRYHETAPFTLDGGAAFSSELRCPRAGSRVLGGYFGTNFSQQVAETLSHPRGKRSWLEGVTNFGGGADNTVFIGIVCALGVK